MPVTQNSALFANCRCATAANSRITGPLEVRRATVFTVATSNQFDGLWWKIQIVLHRRQSKSVGASLEAVLCTVKGAFPQG